MADPMRLTLDRLLDLLHRLLRQQRLAGAGAHDPQAQFVAMQSGEIEISKEDEAEALAEAERVLKVLNKAKQGE